MSVVKNRIILDTNIWLSFLITKNVSKFDKLISANAILIFSDELLNEFMEVVARPKFKYYFNETDVQILLNQISSIAEFVKVKSKLKICRDPKDNFLLSLAVDSKATHLITGDKDLQILEKIEGTTIVSIEKYLKVHG